MYRVEYKASTKTIKRIEGHKDFDTLIEALEYAHHPVAINKKESSLPVHESIVISEIEYESIIITDEKGRVLHKEIPGACKK